MIPINCFFSSTGRCRTALSVMTAIHSSTELCADIVDLVEILEGRFFWQNSIMTRNASRFLVSVFQRVLQRDAQILTAPPSQNFVKLAYEAEIFRSTCKTDFINTICHQRTSYEIVIYLIYWALFRRPPPSHTAQKNPTSHRDQSRIARNIGSGSGDHVQYGWIRRSQALARGA
jgi:hypothetical protein